MGFRFVARLANNRVGLSYQRLHLGELFVSLEECFIPQTLSNPNVALPGTGPFPMNFRAMSMWLCSNYSALAPEAPGWKPG